jgi:predicted NodU family carbamoyl transferase
MYVGRLACAQTMRAETDCRYQELISTFPALTGCPMIFNNDLYKTSEPIISSIRRISRMLELWRWRCESVVR